MNAHPYLRAYMAGITVPTLFLLVVMTGLLIAGHAHAAPVPVERVIVFPMAVVPNLFGAWNMLYLRLTKRRRISIGFYGALLPFVLLPIAVTMATSLGFLEVTAQGLVWLGAVRVSYGRLSMLLPVVVTIYYLVWKHLVRYLNGVLGIA